MLKILYFQQCYSFKSKMQPTSAKKPCKHEILLPEMGYYIFWMLKGMLKCKKKIKLKRLKKNKVEFVM